MNDTAEEIFPIICYCSFVTDLVALWFFRQLTSFIQSSCIEFGCINKTRRRLADNDNITDPI